MTGNILDLLYTNKADFTPYASLQTEGSLLIGVSPEANNRPTFGAGFFGIEQGGWGKHVVIEASGILGSTGTPTYIFQLRLGTSTTWSSSDTSILQTAAITTQSGVSNKPWRLTAHIICRTPGMGTGNCALSCDGVIESPGGLASPYAYDMAPSNAALGTWTATIDGGLTQYLGLSVTCSTSSSSNAVTCKRLNVIRLN